MKAFTPSTLTIHVNRITADILIEDSHPCSNRYDDFPSAPTSRLKKCLFKIVSTRLLYSVSKKEETTKPDIMIERYECLAVLMQCKLYIQELQCLLISH